MSNKCPKCGEDQKLCDWQYQWGDGGVRCRMLQLEHRIRELDAENAKLHKRRNDLENQLCRISACIGKDARHAPEGDPTVAGAVIAEVVALRADKERMDWMDEQCKDGMEITRSQTSDQSARAAIDAAREGK